MTHYQQHNHLLPHSPSPSNNTALYTNNTPNPLPPIKGLQKPLTLAPSPVTEDQGYRFELLVTVPLIVAQNDTSHYRLPVNKWLMSDSMEYWLVMVIQYLTDTMELCLLCPTNLTLTFPDKSSLRPRSYFMSGPESSPQALISCHLVLLFPACPPAPLQADAPQRNAV